MKSVTSHSGQVTIAFVGLYFQCWRRVISRVRTAPYGNRPLKGGLRPNQLWRFRRGCATEKLFERVDEVSHLSPFSKVVPFRAYSGPNEAHETDVASTEQDPEALGQPSQIFLSPPDVLEVMAQERDSLPVPQEKRVDHLESDHAFFRNEVVQKSGDPLPHVHTPFQKRKLRNSVDSTKRRFFVNPVRSLRMVYYYYRV